LARINELECLTIFVQKNPQLSNPTLRNDSFRILQFHVQPQYFVLIVKKADVFQRSKSANRDTAYESEAASVIGSIKVRLKPYFVRISVAVGLAKGY
jgi:hypothetical protein